MQNIPCDMSLTFTYHPSLCDMKQIQLPVAEIYDADVSYIQNLSHALKKEI